MRKVNRKSEVRGQMSEVSGPMSERRIVMSLLGFVVSLIAILFSTPLLAAAKSATQLRSLTVPSPARRRSHGSLWIEKFSLVQALEQSGFFSALYPKR